MIFSYFAMKNDFIKEKNSRDTVESCATITNNKKSFSNHNSIHSSFLSSDNSQNSFFSFGDFENKNKSFYHFLNELFIEKWESVFNNTNENTNFFEFFQNYKLLSFFREQIMNNLKNNKEFQRVFEKNSNKQMDLLKEEIDKNLFKNSDFFNLVFYIFNSAIYIDSYNLNESEEELQKKMKENFCKTVSKKLQELGNFFNQEHFEQFLDIIFFQDTDKNNKKTVYKFETTKKQLLTAKIVYDAIDFYKCDDHILNAGKIRAIKEIFNNNNSNIEKALKLVYEKIKLPSSIILKKTYLFFEIFEDQQEDKKNE